MSISPPPSKRRKLSGSGNKATSRQDTLEIISWNVNGIAPFLQPSITSFFKAQVKEKSDAPPRASLRDFLRRHDYPTMLFLQEVKMNPDDASSVRALEKAVRAEVSHEPDYVAHVCLPSDKFNARGFGRKVYGVGSIIRKDFMDRHVERVRQVEWDMEGRFLVTETKALHDLPRLAIFNIYAVNGTENPYKDPANGVVVGTRHDRKRKVHELLQRECRELEARGFQIILAGDLNIARAPIDGHPNLRTFPVVHGEHRRDFEARFMACGTDRGQKPSTRHEEGLGMIDTFRHLHPAKKGYSYYPRTRDFGESCDRVDMILVSRKLEMHVKKLGCTRALRKGDRQITSQSTHSSRLREKVAAQNNILYHNTSYVYADEDVSYRTPQEQAVAQKADRSGRANVPAYTLR
ncbi:Endonuclease/Exonuclease/phosphatase family [Teratosphaeria destructans]|uniref:Endonuclease/Exonuclease/phosphatase family n=1 Tax=Teratosphaeria destructans TaxID=418781 RepID=A0A9W7SL94_9PEZI|nr:Endonuclease/Exonuclease/phosphatase family [Teratosphaeria destructans]